MWNRSLVALGIIAASGATISCRTPETRTGAIVPIPFLYRLRVGMSLQDVYRNSPNPEVKRIHPRVLMLGLTPLKKDSVSYLPSAILLDDKLFALMVPIAYWNKTAPESVEFNKLQNDLLNKCNDLYGPSRETLARPKTEKLGESTETIWHASGNEIRLTLPRWHSSMRSLDVLAVLSVMKNVKKPSDAPSDPEFEEAKDVLRSIGLPIRS
jgi:hypothetical protein